jgi:hypothetical protein
MMDGTEFDDLENVAPANALPHIQRNLTKAMVAALTKMMTTRLSMRSSTGFTDAFIAELIKDFLALLNNANRCLAASQVRQIHAVIPAHVPPSRITKKRALEIESEEAAQRVTEMGEAEAAARAVVEARRQKDR